MEDIQRYNKNSNKEIKRYKKLSYKIDKIDISLENKKKILR